MHRIVTYFRTVLKYKSVQCITVFFLGMHVAPIANGLRAIVATMYVVIKTNRLSSFSCCIEFRIDAGS